MDLIEAIGRGDIVSVRDILYRGGNPNLVDHRRETALMYVPRGSEDIASLLLDYGANIDQMNGRGETALMRATCISNVDLISLLLSRGANPNIQDNSERTPLTRASYYEELEIVSLLLRYGADPNIVDKRGQSPLILASKFGGKEIVLPLLDYGADPSIVDNKGWTAITVAKTEEIRDMIILYSRSIYTNKDRSRGFMSKRYEDMDIFFSS